MSLKEDCNLKFDNFQKINDIVQYLLSPESEILLPLEKEYNFGIIFTSNLDDLGAIKDTNGELKIDRQKGFQKYINFINSLPNGNYTFYPFHIIKPSDSSKLIHGLDFHTIFDNYSDCNAGLIDFLNKEKIINRGYSYQICKGSGLSMRKKVVDKI